MGKQRVMAVQQLLEAVGDDPKVPRLSARTANDKALGAIGAIFGYAVREDGSRGAWTATAVRNALARL